MLKELINNRIVDIKNGFKTMPTLSDVVSFIKILLAYFSVSFLIIAFSKSLFWQPLKIQLFVPTFMPLIFVLYNAFVEEIIFRGLLLPHRSREISKDKIYLYSILSIIIFVIWHPFTALCFSHHYKHLFLDPSFLTIVLFMAIACTITYLKSGSLWLPIIIHWITIIIWILGFGG